MISMMMIPILLYIFCLVAFLFGLYRLIDYKAATPTDKWLWLIFMLLCPIVGSIIFLVRTDRMAKNKE